MNNTELRQKLSTLRNNAQEQYARFRELASMACRKYPNIIRYSRERHEFYQAYFDGGYKANQIARDLQKLQKNIMQRAMLLHELEWTIDEQEKRERIKHDAQ